MEKPKLTDRQQQVFDVLDATFKSAHLIAGEAGIRTYSGAETAAKYAIQLTKLGLAEKGGTRRHPTWRRTQPAA